MAWEIEKAIIAAGYKTLAKKSHPDAGGTAAQMVALNAARDRLLVLVANFGEGLHAPAGPHRVHHRDGEGPWVHAETAGGTPTPVNPIPHTPSGIDPVLELSELIDRIFGPGMTETILCSSKTLKELVRAINGVYQKPTRPRRKS